MELRAIGGKSLQDSIMSLVNSYEVPGAAQFAYRGNFYALANWA
jgi:hypothetical protein